MFYKSLELFQTFMAVSSVRGALLWTFNDTSLNDIMNLYTGQFVDDLDLDGVRDILNIHGGDPLGEPGREIIFSKIYSLSKNM